MSTVHFPSTYEGGRICIIGFGIYAVFTTIFMFFFPHLGFNLPPLKLIEQLTGLPHIEFPDERQRFLVLIFPMFIGFIYLFAGTLYWNRGGKVLLELGITGRVFVFIVCTATCLFTSFGSSLLLFVAIGDLLAAFWTKWYIQATWNDIVFGSSLSSQNKRQ
eukprot:TRINITY_DN4627_c0_g2_i1.p1 TRINITY_DN4627_c0_g2~~TRINITY_DN4627_c0_g2_i1.p1  ORF type:complete len:161 (-),score=41.94 TRINITY_DN4627_c0_g2_i1:34-516(-)